MMTTMAPMVSGNEEATMWRRGGLLVGLGVWGVLAVLATMTVIGMLQAGQPLVAALAGVLALGALASCGRWATTMVGRRRRRKRAR